MSARHELKTWPEYFRAAHDGSKPLELRWDDREFAVGDVLVAREYHPVKGGYTGASIEGRVTFVMRDAAQFGLMPGYAAMGVRWAAPVIDLDPTEPMDLPQLLAWHQAEARDAALRSENYERAAFSSEAANNPIAAARQRACANAALLEAGFHARAALGLKAYVPVPGGDDAQPDR